MRQDWLLANDLLDMYALFAGSGVDDIHWFTPLKQKMQLPFIENW